MTYIYSLYWARWAHQTDIRNEGYVGVTKRTLGKRRNSHRRNEINEEARALARSKEAVWEVVYDNLSLQQAYEIEEFLRPTNNIGYNIDKGGAPKGCNHSKRTSYHRTITKPYNGYEFYIDDMVFTSKTLATKWLVEHNVCSARTAQRRFVGKSKVTLDECKRLR